MVEALHDRGDGIGERSTGEVLEMLGTRPLLEKLQALVVCPLDTLRTLFRRPGRRGSGITNFPHAA